MKKAMFGGAGKLANHCDERYWVCNFFDKTAISAREQERLDRLEQATTQKKKKIVTGSP